MFFNRINWRIDVTSEKTVVTPIHKINKDPSSQSVTHDHSESHLPQSYSVLYKINYLQWKIKYGDDRVETPNGHYDFVTMLNGEIRIMQSFCEDMRLHSILSNHADTVLFAGKIKFKDNCSSEIDCWTSQSQDYATNADLCEQAGLPISLFIDLNKQLQTIGCSSLS